MESQLIKLSSKEGQEFQISRKAVELSSLIKNILQDNSPDEVIPLLEVDTRTLEHIIAYLQHCDGTAQPEIEKPIRSNIMKNVTDAWSADYVDNLPLQDLIDLTAAANYLEIASLMDLTCAKIASMCKDKSEEEIFQAFGITETLSEEERQKIMEENKWIEDTL